MPLGTIGAALIGSSAASRAAKRTNKSVQEANESAERQRQQSIDFIERSINQARGDIFRLYDSAPNTLQSGLERSADFTRGVVPQQLGLAQEANLAAQNAILQGLPRVRNALLGQESGPPLETVGLTLPAIPQIGESAAPSLPAAGLSHYASLRDPAGNLIIPRDLLRVYEGSLPHPAGIQSIPVNRFVNLPEQDRRNYARATLNNLIEQGHNVNRLGRRPHEMIPM